MNDLLTTSVALLPILIVVLVGNFKSDRFVIVTTLFLAAIAGLIALGVLLADNDVLITSKSVRTLWFAMVCMAIFFGFRIRPSRTQLLKNSIPTLILGYSGFVSYLYPYFKFGSIRAGAPFSNANNDLAIYIISADNFIHAGFKEFSRVVSYQAGALAKFEVSGAASTLGSVTQLLDKPVWRSTNTTMMFVVGLTSIVLFLILISWGMKPIAASIISVIATNATYSRLPQQNYFLSQAISRLCLLLVLLGIIVMFKHSRFSHFIAGAVAVFFGTILSLTTYPAGSISSGMVLLILLIAYGIMALIRRDGYRQILRILVVVGSCIGLALLLLRHRWSLIQSNVSLYSRANVTGWPAPTTDVGNWIGLPALENLKLLNIPITTFVVMSVLILMYRSIKNRTMEMVPPLLLVGILISHVLLSIMLGSSTYQVWKYLATIQPLIVGCALITIFSLFQNNSYVLRTTGYSALIAILLGHAWVGTGMYKSFIQIPTMELETAAKNPRIKTPNLLIGLNPYLETMIAPVILDIHDSIYVSATYLGPESPTSDHCVLRRKTEATTGLEVSRLLILTPASSCP